jgi:hypothetical protein
MYSILISQGECQPMHRIGDLAYRALSEGADLSPLIRLI